MILQPRALALLITVLVCACSTEPPLAYEPSDCKALPAALREGGRDADLGGSAPKGTGALRLEERSVAVFTVICSALPVPVRIKSNSVQRVALRLDENLLPGVEARVDGGRLTLYAAAGFVASPGAEVIVHAQELRSVTHIGGGQVEVGGLHADRVRLQVRGVGKLTAYGEAAHADLTLVGPGHLEAEGLRTKTGRARVEGVGTILVNATERAEIDVVGMGSVEVHGKPGRVIERVDGLGRINVLGR